MSRSSSPVPRLQLENLSSVERLVRASSSSSSKYDSDNNDDDNDYYVNRRGHQNSTTDDRVYTDRIMSPPRRTRRSPRPIRASNDRQKNNRYDDYDDYNDNDDDDGSFDSFDSDDSNDSNEDWSSNSNSRQRHRRSQTKSDKVEIIRKAFRHLCRDPSTKMRTLSDIRLQFGVPNEDGTMIVSSEEFRQSIPKLLNIVQVDTNITMNNNDINYLIEEIDLNHDHSITYAEFINFITFQKAKLRGIARSIQLKLSKTKDLEKIYNTIATKDHRSISIQKFQHLLTTSLGITLHPGEVKTLVNFLDLNNDGQVNYDEFVRFIRDHGGIESKIMNIHVTNKKPIIDIALSFNTKDEMKYQKLKYERLCVDLNHGTYGKEIHLWYLREEQKSTSKNGLFNNISTSSAYLRKRPELIHPIVEVRIDTKDNSSALYADGFKCIDGSTNSGWFNWGTNMYLWIRRDTTKNENPIDDVYLTTGNAKDTKSKIYDIPSRGYRRLQANLNHGTSGSDVFLWYHKDHHGETPRSKFSHSIPISMLVKMKKQNKKTLLSKSISTKTKRQLNDLHEAITKRARHDIRMKATEISNRKNIAITSSISTTGSTGTTDPHNVPGLNLTETFHSLGNKKNKLNMSNFNYLLRKLGCRVDKTTLKNLFAEVDYSNTGYINLQDFLAFVTFKEHDIDDIAARIQAHVIDYGQTKEDGIQNLFTLHSTIQNIFKHTLRSSSKRRYDDNDDNDDNDDYDKNKNTRKNRVLNAHSMNAMAHQVIGLSLTQEESRRLLHRFDYSSNQTYITYQDFYQFIISKNKSQQRINLLKKNRILHCAMVLQRYLQKVANNIVQSYPVRKGEGMNKALLAGAQTAWNTFMNTNKKNRGTVTKTDLEQLLKRLHVDDDIHNGGSTGSSSNTSSSIVGTPRGGISVDLMTELIEYIDPSSSISSMSTSQVKGKKSKAEEGILNYNSMCTFANLGVGSDQPIVDIYVGRSVYDERMISGQKGWYRAGVGQNIISSVDIFNSDRRRRNTLSRYDDDTNDDEGKNASKMKSTRISLWVKRKLTEEEYDNEKSRQKKNKKNKKNRKTKNNKNSQKQNDNTNSNVGNRTKIGSNRPIRRIYIGTHSPNTSKKGCRWNKTDQAIYVSLKTNKKDRYIWYTKDTPSEYEDEQLHLFTDGHDSNGIFHILMDLELLTSTGSIPITNKQHREYISVYGSHPQNQILLDQPYQDDDDDYYNNGYYDNDRYDNGYDENRNNHQMQQTIPLYVYYSIPDVSFVKSGLPDGRVSSNMIQSNNNNKRIYKQGDRVYVGLPSTTSKDGYRWIGPGEITSRGTMNNTFNIYLESGEKMINIATSRLKHTNIQKESDKEVESSSSNSGNNSIHNSEYSAFVSRDQNNSKKRRGRGRMNIDDFEDEEKWNDDDDEWGNDEYIPDNETRRKKPSSAKKRRSSSNNVMKTLNEITMKLAIINQSRVGGPLRMSEHISNWMQRAYRHANRRLRMNTNYNHYDVMQMTFLQDLQLKGTLHRNDFKYIYRQLEGDRTTLKVFYHSMHKLLQRTAHRSNAIKMTDHQSMVTVGLNKLRRVLIKNSDVRTSFQKECERHDLKCTGKIHCSVVRNIMRQHGVGLHRDELQALCRHYEKQKAMVDYEKLLNETMPSSNMLSKRVPYSIKDEYHQSLHLLNCVLTSSNNSIRSLRNVFEAIDRQGSGTVTFTEFQQAL
jgi:Ca2+-binding EF-hand superfamily protein